jgi:hypothetical protein
LNPDADDSGVCPDGYSCTSCEATGCGAGEQCFDGGCRPDPREDVCRPTDDSCDGCGLGCVELESGSIVCSALCFLDEDCGPCGACVELESHDLWLCLNHDHADVGSCPDGWTCTPSDGDGDGDSDGDGDGDGDGDSDGDGDGDGDGEPPGRCDCRAPGSATSPEAPAALCLGGLLLLTIYGRRSRSR